MEPVSISRRPRFATSPDTAGDESIRRLSARLRDLEVLLGRPDAPPDLEVRVVRLAHRLRNEINVRQLALHPDVVRARLRRAETAH